MLPILRARFVFPDFCGIRGPKLVWHGTDANIRSNQIKFTYNDKTETNGQGTTWGHSVGVCFKQERTHPFSLRFGALGETKGSGIVYNSLAPPCSPNRGEGNLWLRNSYSIYDIMVASAPCQSSRAPFLIQCRQNKVRLQWEFDLVIFDRYWHF